MNAIMISYIDVLCDKKSIYKRLSLFVLTFCALFYGVFFVFLIKKNSSHKSRLDLWLPRFIPPIRMYK